MAKDEVKAEIENGHVVQVGVPPVVKRVEKLEKALPPTPG